MHPVITQAIVDGLDRATLDPPMLEQVRATLRRGNPVDERLHRTLKQFLFDHGGPSRSFETGRRFARDTDHPLLSLIALSRSPAELIHRARRLEPLLHLGNRTVITVSPTELRVVHQSNRGVAPTPGESLFVCGAQCGALERIGVSGLKAFTNDSNGEDHTVWPGSDRPDETPESSSNWTIRWASAPEAPLVPTTGVLAEDIRARITDQPEQPWTLSDVARSFALSPRSLQRSLQQQNTELRHLVRAGRVEAAWALLLRTDVPISVVAYLCGFADSAHLANVTRTFYDTTPTALRAQPAPA